MSKKHGKKQAREDAAPDAPPAIAAVAGPWRELVVVCRKCGGKIGKGGFGKTGRDTLPQALKQLLRDRGRRRDVQLVETGCLGICPKNAVMLLRGDAPGDALAVPKGVDLAELADRLGFSPIPAKAGGGGAGPRIDLDDPIPPLPA